MCTRRANRPRPSTRDLGVVPDFVRLWHDLPAWSLWVLAALGEQLRYIPHVRQAVRLPLSPSRTRALGFAALPHLAGAQSEPLTVSLCRV